MIDHTEELVSFIQEHCLWQFASRAHDREDNINGVLSIVGEILIGSAPKLTTPMDRCHFANANHLASEVKTAFPWLKDMDHANLSILITGVIGRIREIAIEQSKNEELHLQAY